MKTTIYHVADKAGVCIASVSRVLNNHPSVSSEMRANVEKAIKDLSWIPNYNARHTDFDYQRNHNSKGEFRIA